MYGTTNKKFCFLSSAKKLRIYTYERETYYVGSTRLSQFVFTFKTGNDCFVFTSSINLQFPIFYSVSGLASTLTAGSTPWPSSSFPNPWHVQWVILLRTIVKLYGIKEDGQCTYHVATRRARVTIGAVEKQYVLNIMNACIRSLVVRHAKRMRRDIVICGLSGSNKFFTLSHKGHDFRKSGWA